MRFFVLLVFSIAYSAWLDCSVENDGHGHNKTTWGPYKPVGFLDVKDINGTQFYVAYPNETQREFPLVVFMHGSTGQWEMYSDNLLGWASQGFVVIFPFIKSPEDDKHFWVTNTNGEFILKGIEYGKNANVNLSSPLYNLIDTTRIATAGHSMGASCSIMAGHRSLPDSLKTVVTMHPGICGPIGPPPYPATWMKSDLKDVLSKFPVLFTTATNDAAFWPAPHTAQHELGCFNGSKIDKGRALFLQFTADACQEDHKHPPFSDEGHDCPFKAGVETPWVTTWLKLYLHQDGDPNSNCYKLIWNQNENSLLKNDRNIELFVMDEPKM